MGKYVQEFMASGQAAEISGILIVLLALSVAFWFLIGRFKLHNLLINIYISFALIQVVAPQAQELGKLAPILIFIACLVFFTMIDSSLFEIHPSGSGLRIWQVIILSVLEAGLLLSIMASLTPQKHILDFISSETLEYFTSPWTAIGWMVAPLLFLLLISKRAK